LAHGGLKTKTVTYNRPNFYWAAAAWCLAPWMPLDPWDVMGLDEAVRLITDRENRR